MKTLLFKLKSVLILLILTVAFVLMACSGPTAIPATTSPTEAPEPTPIPFKPTDKLTIVVEGHSTDISWESDPGCVLTIRETGTGPGDPGNFNISSGLCTPEMVTLLLEGIKKTTTSATPEWQIQTLDKAIDELKQYE